MTINGMQEMAMKWAVINFDDPVDEEFELTAESDDDSGPCCYGFVTSRGQNHEIDCYMEMTGREWLSRFDRAMNNDF